MSGLQHAHAILIRAPRRVVPDFAGQEYIRAVSPRHLRVAAAGTAQQRDAMNSAIRFAVPADRRAERILRESTIFTDVQPQNGGSAYRAQVRLYEGQNLALSVKITVPDEATARSFQRRFASRGSTLREDIMALCYSIPDEGAALANEEDR